MVLPHEIIREVSLNLDVPELCKTMIYVNQKFSEECKIRRDLYINKVTAIQRFYKRNPIVVFYDIAYPTVTYTKVMNVRRYIAKYPMRYLQMYPEFLTKKITCRLNQDKIGILNKYIEEKMPLPLKRTRRDMRDFLNLELITNADLRFAGW